MGVLDIASKTRRLDPRLTLVAELAGGLLGTIVAVALLTALF
jgi:hypothetical protein